MNELVGSTGTAIVGASQWDLKTIDAGPREAELLPIPATIESNISPDALAGNPDEALEFMRGWPTERCHLWFKKTDPVTGEEGASFGRTYERTEAGYTKMRANIAAAEGKFNSYFLVNDPLDSVTMDVVGKPTNAQIKRVVALHVDIDPSEERALPQILEQAQGFKFAPSRVIASGGGAGVFFVLQPMDQIVIDGDPSKAEEAARYNRQLATDLGGDHCHDVSRVMRLPGTWNLPNAKKRERGREPALARMIESNDLRYPISAFAKAALPEATGIEIKIDWSGVHEHEDLINNLPLDIPRLARMILADQGDLQELNADLKAAGVRKTGYNSHSNAVHGLASSLKGYGKLSLEAIAALMWRAPICGKHFGKKSEAEIRRAIERSLTRSITPTSNAGHFNGEGPLVSEFDHVARAHLFIEKQRPNLHHYRGDFTDYDHGRHAVVEDDTLKADLYGFLDGCGKMVGEEPVPFHPSIGSVNETLSAAKALGHLLPSIEQPYWLDGRDGPDPSDLVSFPNGIYDLSSETFLPPDPMLFTPNAAGFDYDTKASDPVNWKEFLKQIYDGEQDQIDSWQEWSGYCVSSDVSQEKGALLIGGKRSGKDTSRHVVQSLLPADAVIGPTLDSMGRAFGMQPFIGKQLAVVGDMRIGAKCDPELLAENVLKITGRGLFTIPRKYKGDWTGTLGAKLMLISNERPKLRDASGALASRFIVFQTRRSFYGQEDRYLFRDKLHPELPGIMLWALDGLRRLRSNGQIAEPKCSVEEREQLERDGSPVLSFVRECLTLDLDAVVPKDEMHAAFCDYAAANGLRQLDKVSFGRDLLAATGGSVRPHRMTDASRTWGFKGANITSRPAARKKTPDLVDLAKAIAVATQKKETGNDDIPF